MRYIDFEGKTPVNTPADPDFTAWVPWTQEKWDAWVATSQQYYQQLEAYHKAGEIDDRNKFIDDHSAHWGELKQWLEVLSKGKCWFSEVREAFSHYDVEHFRPKKEAKALDGTKRDGYWWLAFNYTNYRLCGNVGNRKKGGWFPLMEGSVLSTYEIQREESEDIYLLDPIDKHDVTLVAFDEEGNMIPAPGISAWEVKRVEETVNRLKLNEHPELTEERKKTWQEISREIEMYQDALSRCSAGGNPAAKEKAKRHALRIRTMTNDAAQLSTVAKWCLLFRNDPQLARLAA